LPTDISTISATWDSFLGNAHILDVLQRAVKKNRLPHAMIFSGPPSVGKRTLGNLLAQRLDCLNDAIDGACGVCGSCRKIISGAHPDVREIQPDGANIKIDQIRNLVNEIAYQPFEARYRVAILDSADKMNKEAGNCLLRTLEEPVSRTILILVTTVPACCNLAASRRN
jgi:DNA polymerase-3 subunit delta'